MTLYHKFLEVFASFLQLSFRFIDTLSPKIVGQDSVMNEKVPETRISSTFRHIRTYLIAILA